MPTTTLPSGQTALWTVPDARSDRERGLALMFVGICILDSIKGCYARNQWFLKLVGKGNESTIRRYNQELAECGLIEVEVTHGRDRLIRPLVPIADVLREGWKALALAVLDFRGAPRELKRLAGLTLKRWGRGFCDLKKLGLEPLPKPKKRENRTPTAPSIARVIPNKERSEEATAMHGTQRSSASLSGTPGIAEASGVGKVDPAAASLLEKMVGLMRPEALSLARWAQEAGATLPQIQSACAVMASRSPGTIRSKPGYFHTLIQAALKGDTLSLTPPPATHPSDLGQRPGPRVTVAPREFAQQEAERIKPAAIPDLDAALAALDEGERTRLIDEAVELTLKGVVSLVNRQRIREKRERYSDVRAILRNKLGL